MTPGVVDGKLNLAHSDPLWVASIAQQLSWRLGTATCKHLVGQKTKIPGPVAVGPREVQRPKCCSYNTVYSSERQTVRYWGINPKQVWPVCRKCIRGYWWGLKQAETFCSWRWPSKMCPRAAQERGLGIPLKVQQGPPPTGQADRFEEQWRARLTEM